jgi:hypothetical protein
MRTNTHPHSHSHHQPNRSVRLHWNPHHAKENLPAAANLPERPQTKPRIQGMSLREERARSPGRSEL